MNLSELVQAGDAAGLIARIPYFCTLGVEIATTEPVLATHLPFRRAILATK